MTSNITIGYPGWMSTFYNNAEESWKSCLVGNYHDILRRGRHFNIHHTTWWNSSKFRIVTPFEYGVYTIIFVDSIDNILLIRNDNGCFDISGNAVINYRFFDGKVSLLKLTVSRYCPSDTYTRSGLKDTGFTKYVVVEYQKFFIIIKKILKYLGLENIWLVIRMTTDDEICDCEISDTVYI